MRVRALVLVVLALLLLAPPSWGQSTHVEPRSTNNLLLCSWNIKWFKDSGRDVAKLAKVIAKFDICGIVELQSDLVLDDLASALQTEAGEAWTYIQSNRTGNNTSYFEQFAFIWRDQKVRIASGHVGNVSDLPNTFRHQPYIAGFRSGNFDFRFLLIHTRWTTATERAKEVEQIAHDFRFFQTLGRERDLILAGDFNYANDVEAMRPVTELDDMINLIPANTRTTLKGSGEGFSSSYDHIYVNKVATTERTGKAGAYDFVFGQGYTSTQTAKKELSDHLPVWAQFKTDGPDDD
jgi:deoxyribonuclease-1-like protein